jgi:hypothetical protein
MNTPAPRAPHSAFITSLAWTFLGLGVLGGLIYFVQLVIVFVMFSSADYQALAQQLEATQSMPPILVWITKHVYAWMFIMLGLSGITTWASFALLQRREWARVFFFWMMVAAVLSHIAAAVAPFYLRDSLQTLLLSFPVEIRAELQATATLMTWVSVLLAVIFGALFAWCAVKLVSPPIKREFGGV